MVAGTQKFNRDGDLALGCFADEPINCKSWITEPPLLWSIDIKRGCCSQFFLIRHLIEEDVKRLEK